MAKFIFDFMMIKKKYILIFMHAFFLILVFNCSKSVEVSYYFPPPGQEPDKQDIQTPTEAGLKPEIVEKLKIKNKEGRWALWPIPVIQRRIQCVSERKSDSRKRPGW